MIGIGQSNCGQNLERSGLFHSNLHRILHACSCPPWAKPQLASEQMSQHPDFQKNGCVDHGSLLFLDHLMVFWLDQ